MDLDALEGVLKAFRVRLEGVFDVDITGDQLGYDWLLVRPMGRLYKGTRVRSIGEADEETKARSALLAKRAHAQEFFLNMLPK